MEWSARGRTWSCTAGMMLMLQEWLLVQVDDAVGSSKLQQAVVWVRKLHIRALIQVHFRQRDPIFFVIFYNFLYYPVHLHSII